MTGEVRLDGRVAVVSGAGRGLGRSHALLLAARGARVLVNDIGCELDGAGRSATPAEQVAAEIEAAGGIAVANTDTVATPEGGRAIIDHAVEVFGRVDIVVNNAGILRDKAFHNLDPSMVREVIDVHLHGAFWLTIPAFSRMREQGYGRILNTTSDAGLFGNFGQSAYGAAKTGLLGLTRVLALEGARHNIKVNAVAPVGLTRMNIGLRGADDSARSSQVSAVVAWLVHEDCPVTGEIFQVRRGRIARVFLGRTAGYHNVDPTPEDVREHFAEVCDLNAFVVPSVGEV